MVRGPYFDKNGTKKGAWSKEEDDKLKAFVQKHGHKNWRQLPKFAGLQRCGKSCRIRWLNYLRPDVKHGGYSKEEEGLIIQLYDQLGSKWSKIAEHLPGRTDNEVKNHWHTHLKKRGNKQIREITNYQGSKLDQTIESSSQIDEAIIIIQEVTKQEEEEENTEHPTNLSIPSQPITILESFLVSPSTSSTTCASSSSSSSNVALDNYGVFDGVGDHEDDDIKPYEDQFIMGSPSFLLEANLSNYPVVLDDTNNNYLPLTASPSESSSFLSYDHLNYMVEATNPMDWIVEESSNDPLEVVLESDNFWTEPFVLDLNTTDAATKYDYPVSSNPMSWELNYDYIY